jgi:ubiquinone biosynthesis protein UbiJ
MTVAAKPLMAAINHLLAREAWARAKLVPYAGRRARVTFALGNLDLEVRPDGLFGPVAPAHREHRDEGAAPTRADATGTVTAHTTAPATTTQGGVVHARPVLQDAAPVSFDVTIAVEAAAAPAFLSGGQAGAMKHIRIEGDAEFATALGYLAEHLRWEPEEDLARVIGDAGAHRAASIARDVAGRARRTGRNFIESVAEYLLDEDPRLVRRGELDALTTTLTRTRDDVARLEKRLERVERIANAGAAGTLASGTAPKHADGKR